MELTSEQETDEAVTVPHMNRASDKHCWEEKRQVVVTHTTYD